MVYDTFKRHAKREWQDQLTRSIEIMIVCRQQELIATVPRQKFANAYFVYYKSHLFIKTIRNMTLIQCNLPVLVYISY